MNLLCEAFARISFHSIILRQSLLQTQGGLANNALRAVFLLRKVNCGALTWRILHDPGANASALF